LIYRLITYRYRDDTTVAQIDELHQLMQELDSALAPEIKVLYGPDVMPANKDPRREAYLVIAPDGDKLLNYYQPHPLHQEMLARLDWLEDMVAADLQA